MSLLRICLSVFCFATATAWCQDLKKEWPRSFKVAVSNTLKTDRENVMVTLSGEALAKQVPGFNPSACIVLDHGKEIPSQYNFHDDEQAGIVVVLDNLKGEETRELVVRYKDHGALKRRYPKRTQAELSHKFGGRWVNREYEGGAFRNVSHLRVPPEHKDHSWYIRYEGPGWESDKVGYRFYLDQRNAIDVFGKKTHDMVLQQVGLDGFDSYHSMQPWGMDVMKVGPSLGIGSIGAWSNGKVVRVEKTDSVTCSILENGDVYSSFLTSYYGWKVGEKKYDVQSHIDIHAGSRVSSLTLALDHDADSLCTGIVKDKNARLVTAKGDASRYGYIATYGLQSLNSDRLGVAVFFDPGNWVGFSEDAHSHIVTLRSSGGKLRYYFLAAWELEPGGIKNEADFLHDVDTLAQQLAHPVEVRIMEVRK